jgi:hypothetical protein
MTLVHLTWFTHWLSSPTGSELRKQLLRLTKHRLLYTPSGKGFQEIYRTYIEEYKIKEQDMPCSVHLLDGTVENVALDKHAKGHCLLEEVRIFSCIIR